MMLVGDLVITEVFADFAAAGGGTGADEGKEWFEIFNASERPIELKGLTIVHGRPDGSKQKSHVMDDVTIAPGQFFTLGNSIQDLLPAYIDYGYSADLGDMFNTDGGKLELRCADQAIDAAVYDTVKSGRSRQLTSAQPPDYTLNDELTNWCEAKDTAFEESNFGTPGQDNDCTPVVVGQCSDNGTMRDTVAPEAGDLVITELMPSPEVPDDTLGEWFEARVVRDVDLNGIALERVGDSTAPNVIASTTCLRVTTGQSIVFARNADPLMNNGLPVNLLKGTFRFTMVGGTAAAPGDVQILSGATVVDAVTWSRSTNGKALQLDPDIVDATANDDQSNFCDATMPYGGGATPDLGTPGALNTQCSGPTQGTCMDGLVSRPIVKPGAGALVITEVMPNPEGDDAKEEWFEITNTSNAAFDLNDLSLDRAGDGSAANKIISAACKSVPAGGFALFARSNDPAQNDMLPAVDATFSFLLVGGTAANPGDVQILDGTTVIDKVTWTTSAARLSLQLDPDQLTQAGNDVEANFCPGTTAYGAHTPNPNRGTPKVANLQCP